jgi:hypothetical protein
MSVCCHGETKLNIQMLEKEVNEKQVKNDTPVSPSSIDTGGTLAMPPPFPYPSSFSRHRWRGVEKAIAPGKVVAGRFLLPLAVRHGS